MPSVTDLPIRESTSPRESGGPNFEGFQMPSMWQCVKAGFCLFLGAWIAAAFLAVPSAIVFLRVELFLMELMMRR